MTSLQNILLVYPEVPKNTYWSFKYALKLIRKQSNMPPLGLLTVAALIPDRYRLKLIDMNVTSLTDADIEWADVVFVSAMIVQKAGFAEVVDRCNRVGRRVVAGGPYPTACHREITGVDYLVLGEAEHLVGPLLEDLEQGTARSEYRSGVRPDLSESAVPRFDLLDLDAYASMAVQYSRGCPFRCEFCDIWPVYGNRPRLKAADRMTAEMEALYRLGWRGSVFIVDDNFIGNRGRLKRELLPALRQWQADHGFPFRFFTEASIDMADDPEILSGMRDAGFNEVFIGIETPSAEALAETGKAQNLKTDMVTAIRQIKAHGMGVMGGFILGFDSDTEDIFDRQVEFIEQNGIAMAMIGLLTALPGTRLYARLRREGRLRAESDGNNTHHLVTNFVPKMDEDQLRRGYRRVLSAIYDRNLSRYFDRCNRLLDGIGPTNYFQRPIRPKDLRILFRSLCRQPFTPYGLQYLKFVIRNLILHRRAFSETISLSLMGHHFHVITQQTLKMDTITHTLDEMYARLRDRMDGYSKTATKGSREAIRQVRRLWKKRRRMLKRTRRRIDRLPAELRVEANRKYRAVSEGMRDLIRRFEWEHDQTLGDGC